MSELNELVELYRQEEKNFKFFLDQVVLFFDDPSLKESPLSIVHSVKYRLKNPDHLLDKLKRKIEKGEKITKKNLFKKITDFAGVRVLHLCQNQFPDIHAKIMDAVKSKKWILVEDPIAYTWDPESKDFYEKLGVKTTVRDSYYTSIHYVIRANEISPYTCEIQVRTLFEEIWGEIDHAINYPHPTTSVACREELRVLSKLASTGTRLADSIFKSYEEFKLSQGRKQKKK